MGSVCFVRMCVVRLVKFIVFVGFVVVFGCEGEIMEDLVAVSKLQDYFLNIKRLGTTLDDVEDDAELDGEE